MNPVDELISILESYRNQERNKRVAVRVIKWLGDQFKGRNIALKEVIDFVQNCQNDFPSALEQYDRVEVLRIFGLIMDILQDEKSISVLQGNLQHASYWTAVEITTLFGWFGEKANQALPDLILWAADNQNFGSVHATRSIMQIGKSLASSYILKQLLAYCLKSQKEGNGVDARDLTNMGYFAIDMNCEDTPEFYEYVTCFSKSKDWETREMMVGIIKSLSLATRQQYGQILAMLRADPNEQVRVAVEKAGL